VQVGAEPLDVRTAAPEADHLEGKVRQCGHHRRDRLRCQFPGQDDPRGAGPPQEGGGPPVEGGKEGARMQLHPAEAGVAQRQQEGEVGNDHTADFPSGEVDRELRHRREHLLRDRGDVQRQVDRDIPKRRLPDEGIQLLHRREGGLLVGATVAGDDRPEPLRPEGGNRPGVELLRAGVDQDRRLFGPVGGRKDPHRCAGEVRPSGITSPPASPRSRSGVLPHRRGSSRTSAS